MSDSNDNILAERVWCDGCYDMVHFGHANQLRQAKQFGKKLIVGVHNDEEVTMHKGPPVFNEQERYKMVRAIRWVDEVIEDAPYVTSVETLDKHDCEFCIHGDDITMTADGKDTYGEVKLAGRYKECKRTAGVSTTDLVGRMLLLTRSHHSGANSIEEHKEKAGNLSSCSVAKSPWTRVSRFMASSKTILQFSAGKERKNTDKAVYVFGGFDLFHIGHLSFLEEAKKLGDYLIVGILTDQDVNAYKGDNHPIMSLHERVLSVLAYKPVDEVVIGAPREVTDELIEQFNISLVVTGTRVPHHEHEGPDPLVAARNRGILREVDSGSDMTTDIIIQRIIDHRLTYETRNKKKEKKEAAAFLALQGLAGDTTKTVSIEADK